MLKILVGCANLTAWCSGPRGRALTCGVLLLGAVRLCAGVPARSTVRRDVDVGEVFKWCACLNSTSNQTIVAERGTDLGRQVHSLSYKAV
ncbi:hypothetical protein ACE6H2_015074 [Prunus campanulata]